MALAISRTRSLLYALGATGYGIADRLVVVLGLYFYLPPAGRGLTPLVPTEAFWGVLTAYGVAMGFGRAIDAIADPLVGHASDRSRSRLGRRRGFLIYAMVPMVACAVLIFYPPGAPGSAVNALFLGLVLAVFFAAFTAYVAPLLALLPEIATSPEQRLRLATLLGAASLIGLLGFAPLAFAGIELVRPHVNGSTASAVRWVAVGLGVSSLVLCALPVLAIDERKLSRSTPSALPLVRAILQTLRYRPFLIYLTAQICMVAAIQMAAPLPVYLATAILGKAEGFAGALFGVILVATLIGLPIVWRVVRRVGPKRALLSACLFAAPCFAAWGALRPAAQSDPLNLALTYASLAGVGLCVAAFAVVPYLLISQLIDADETQTGSSRAAMFFGMQGLMLKWVYGAAAALLAFLFAAYGNSADEPGGILLAGPIASLFCVAAAAALAAYPERAVLLHGTSKSEIAG